jgi:hypothetical protein
VSSSIEESTGIGIFTPLVRVRNCIPVVAGLGNACGVICTDLIYLSCLHEKTKMVQMASNVTGSILFFMLLVVFIDFSYSNKYLNIKFKALLRLLQVGRVLFIMEAMLVE